MVEVQYNFQGSLWTYTYASGPDAGSVFFQSPQRCWSNRRKSLVVRQANSDKENKVWLNRDPSLLKRCGDCDPVLPTLADAHGVIARDGWGTAVQPSCGSPEGDGAPLIPYHRGERVWVEQSLSPVDKGESVPVISIDTLEFFRIPSKYICFVPQLAKTDNRGIDCLATPAGPVHNITRDGRQRQTQAFFKWPAGRPQETTREWDSWDSGDAETLGARKLNDYRHVSDVYQRRQLFRQQWAVLSENLAAAVDDGEDSDDCDLIVGDGCQLESLPVSDCSKDTLGKQLAGDSAKHGPVNKDNCCNLAPGCDMTRWQVEIEPGQLVGMENLRHHHVQSTDVEHCPAGKNHGDHCVLWDDRTRCLLDGRAVDHTCCVPLAQVFGPRTPEEAKMTSKFSPPVGELPDIGDPDYISASELDEMSLEDWQAPSDGAPTTCFGMYQKQRRAIQLHLESQQRQYQLKLRMQHRKGQQTAPSAPTSVYQGQTCQQNQQHDDTHSGLMTTPPVDSSLNATIPSSSYSSRGMAGHYDEFTSATKPSSSTCAKCAQSPPSSTSRVTINLTINHYNASTN